jgi:hypothetical protein
VIRWLVPLLEEIAAGLERLLKRNVNWAESITAFETAGVAGAARELFQKLNVPTTPERYLERVGINVVWPNEEWSAVVKLGRRLDTALFRDLFEVMRRLALCGFLEPLPPEGDRLLLDQRLVNKLKDVLSRARAVRDLLEKAEERPELSDCERDCLATVNEASRDLKQKELAVEMAKKNRHHGVSAIKQAAARLVRLGYMKGDHGRQSKGYGRADNQDPR